MKRSILFAAAGALLVSLVPGAPPARAAMSVSPAITAAVADPARPAADRARDKYRKPAACLAFAGVQPGMSIAELFPSKGYFTRIFSRVVGPKGHVYEFVPPPKKAGDPIVVGDIAADPHYDNNITVSIWPVGRLPVREPVDLVWTSQNYHDLHLTRLHIDIAALDAGLFAALKPGGVFMIVDHAAELGSGTRDTDKMHRIDENLVKTEMKAAGFVLEDESDVLRNPADTHTLLVFDPAIRGHTDQFVLRFRKPRS